MDPLRGIYTLTPAYPDVDKRRKRKASSGLNTCMASGQYLRHVCPGCLGVNA
ncbi:hypothetical protein [uncultured Muribaculum sp.]|nr:hypothetical protein [uncultured Muribaculum sp.]